MGRKRPSAGRVYLPNIIIGPISYFSRMEFRVKNFAQLMILSADVAIIFDDITGGKFNIDSYELAERPEIAPQDFIEAMNQAYKTAIATDHYKSLYETLFEATNDELFWVLLKRKNDGRRHIS